MFNGLVNLHDFVVLAEKLRARGAGRIIAKLTNGKAGRVRKTWEHTAGAPTHWWDIPAVVRRWNRLITGDPDLDTYTYVTRTYFAGREELHALSLGCGTGARELVWMKSGGLATLDGYDLSAERIEHASRRAREEGLQDRLRFFSSDVSAIEVGDATYDVIIVEGALHHFAPLRPIMERIRGWMKPAGLLVINEYIGPSRFQWSDRQLAIVNELLAEIPESYRRTWSGGVKRRAYRPGRLSMYLNDPSEAAESAMIVPHMRELFTVIEEKMYGGTILQLLFNGIAHNFLDESDRTMELLQRLFDAEDAALRAGDVGSDFGFFICGR